MQSHRNYRSVALVTWEVACMLISDQQNTEISHSAYICLCWYLLVQFIFFMPHYQFHLYRLLADVPEHGIKVPGNEETHICCVVETSSLDCTQIAIEVRLNIVLESVYFSRLNEHFALQILKWLSISCDRLRSKFHNYSFFWYNFCDLIFVVGHCDAKHDRCCKLEITWLSCPGAICKNAVCCLGL